ANVDVAKANQGRLALDVSGRGLGIVMGTHGYHSPRNHRAGEGIASIRGTDKGIDQVRGTRESGLKNQAKRKYDPKLEPGHVFFPFEITQFSKDRRRHKINKFIFTTKVTSNSGQFTVAGSQ